MDPTAACSSVGNDTCSAVGAWLLALGTTTALISLVLFWYAWALLAEARRRVLAIRTGREPTPASRSSSATEEHPERSGLGL